MCARIREYISTEHPMVGRHYREAVVACLGRLPASSLNSTRPVVASRLRFWGRPAFDARPLMDPVTRRAFVSPSFLALRRAPRPQRAQSQLQMGCCRQRGRAPFEDWGVA